MFGQKNMAIKYFFPFYSAAIVCEHSRSPGLHFIHRYKSVRDMQCLRAMRIHYYSLQRRIYWISGSRYSVYIWKRRREGKSVKPNLFSALCVYLLQYYSKIVTYASNYDIFNWRVSLILPHMPSANFNPLWVHKFNENVFKYLLRVPLAIVMFKNFARFNIRHVDTSFNKLTCRNNWLTFSFNENKHVDTSRNLV